MNSLLGGASLSISAVLYRRITGKVYGVSSFLHNPSIQLLHIFLTGALLQLCIPSLKYTAAPTNTLWLAISGLFVGAGSKLANGCTSGHMICGIGMLQRRSMIATALFFAAAIPTAYVFHSGNSNLAAQNSTHVNFLLGASGLIALAISVIANAPAFVSASFGSALLLSGMVDPFRILNFMQFTDPSLLFLAIGAIPVSIVGHLIVRAPANTRQVDTRLVLGSILFGFGWALSGLCPAPALINFGRSFALADMTESLRLFLWLAAAHAGGRVAKFME